jgi:hypothetical protein
LQVPSLGYLQAIKLTNAEPAKGGECKLSFLAGHRALLNLGSLVNLQRSITMLLNCGPEDFEARIGAMQAGAKAGAKERAALVSEVGKLTAQSYRAEMVAASDEAKCCGIHRHDGDGSYCAAVASGMDKSGVSTSQRKRKRKSKSKSKRERECKYENNDIHNQKTTTKKKKKKKKKKQKHARVRILEVSQFVRTVGETETAHS